MPITIISDLGNSSPYVPWFETQIRENFPDQYIHILTHEVAPFKIIDAVYRWKCTIGKFPENTFHISLYDTLLSFPQHILVKKHENNYYIGVDNGMLTTTFDYSENNEADIVATQDVAANFSDFISIVIKAIRILFQSGVSDKYFLQVKPSVIYNFPKSIIHKNRIDCLILSIDRQDNIITDLTYEVYEEHLKGREYIIKLHRNDSIHRISEQPAYNNKGELMAYFNDFGFMQISMSSKNSRTASLLGLHAYQKESFINSYIIIEVSETVKNSLKNLY